MKYGLFTISLLVASQAYAAQCNVDLKNDIRLNDKTLEIHQKGGDTAIVDAENTLTIHGEEIPLDASQQQAIADYRSNLNDYLPRAKQIAQDGLALANDIIDDVGQSFDAPEAFDSVKASMQQFYADIEARYYQNGDLILPADSFASLRETWTEDFESAKKLFNEEFITSAFNAMSEKMQAEGGLNLTEMADTMSELKERIAKRLEAHSVDVEKQSQEFCDSLDSMAEQEKELHKKIPQLKDYQVFTI
ncbi:MULTISPECIES: YggN family protein [Vibrio]|uniref:YggN family protein n=1 Tax=Vibrio TaxID=662 RepID=UPI002075F03E|nr:MULTISPECIES: YggN family protein [Vibrio]USD31940.1 YggN family protein [Vibrio sp. SCSIO 43186]USD44984.1 YggN family protein [Vibrio sp. SCSIO 43145]USD69063.1 YggN family protein [Vibrio sp. SCSIO 43139]USD96751.1 chemotaxis protein [Vibrio coralliilyticus]